MIAISPDLAGIQVLTAADGTAYEDVLKRWSEAAEQRADCVVFPTNSEDVSKAIRYATHNNLELAIKCGGHCISGASSASAGGLVLDLAKLNSVHVDAEHSLLKVGGGALWVDVDVAAGKYGLATVGGTVNHTGVGGLTLGGGYGWLSARYGLTIDVLEEVEIVLADGSILIANESKNVDLFWAIRGGGSNFGVVTSFTFRAFPQANDVWTGLLFFPAQKVEAVFNAAKSWEKSFSDDEGCMMFMACPPPSHQPSLVVAPFFNGPAEEGKKRFSAFYDLDPVADTTREMPYCAVNGILNPLAPYGGRKLFRGAVFTSLEPPRFKTLFENFANLVSEVPETKDSAIIIELHSFRKIISVPTNATAFANRGEWYNLNYSVHWKDVRHDEYLRAWSRDQIDFIYADERKNGTKNVENRVYSNYTLGVEDPRDIFGENYERLQRIKAKYDPNNVFHKWFPIVPVA